MSHLKTAPALLALLAWLAAGHCPAQTNTSPPADVVLLGTLHGSHRTSTNYSLDVLRKIIVTVKPAAILVEQPPDREGKPTVRDGRVVDPGGSVESVVANAAAEDLGIDVIPYDREGRDELYVKTRYFARQQAADTRLGQWLEARKREDPESIALLADRLQRESISGQNRLSRNGPETINSPEYDMVIAAKHSLLFGTRPKILMASGERELAEELLFVSDEWQERNQIMARHIREAAGRFPGKRLVVLAGAEHRYILRELLSKAQEVVVREYYELPEWSGAKALSSTGSVGREQATASAAQNPSKSSREPDEPAYTLVGIGAELETGYPGVKRLFPNSPAEACGQLRPGDRIVGVAQGNRAFVDTRPMSLQELVQTIRGKPGTTIRLQVVSADAKPEAAPIIISLTRAPYRIN